MTWPRVKTGDKLHIPADLHNATIETVEAFRRNKNRTGGPAMAQRPRQALILVKNGTGADLAVGGVLGLSAPIWPGYVTYPEPTAQGLQQFLGAEILFLGALPAEADHEGKFAIAVEPIPNGAVGRACVQGVVRVKVQIADLDVADWADITDGEVNFLTAGTSGSARILWYEGDETGLLWAVCLLGASAYTSTPTGEAETHTYTYKAHLGAGICTDDMDPFWTIPDSLNADIVIFPEGRACEDVFDGDSHPKQKGLISYAGNLYGMQDWKVEEEGDDDWTDIIMPVVLINGTVVQFYSSSGGYSNAHKLQVRVNTGGELQFRFWTTVEPGTGPVPAPFILYLSVMVIKRISGLDVDELGTAEGGEDIYGTPFCDHELHLGPEWNPETDPTPYEWGDGLWRHV